MIGVYLRGVIERLILPLALLLNLGGCAGIHQGRVPALVGTPQRQVESGFTGRGYCVQVKGGYYHKYTKYLVLNRLACVRDGNQVVDYRQALARDLKALLPDAQVVLYPSECPKNLTEALVRFRGIYEGWGDRWGTVFEVQARGEGSRGYISPSMAAHKENPFLVVNVSGLSHNEKWIARSLALIAVYARAFIAPEGDPVLAWVEKNPPESRPCWFCGKTHWAKWFYKVKVEKPCPGDGVEKEKEVKR